MKQTILTTALTLGAVSAILAADTTTHRSSASSSVKVDPNGKATITIEINGRKEVREVDIGNGTSITVLPTEAKPAAAGRKPWLGIASDELAEETRAQLPVAAGTGLIVRSVVPGSPAAQAGLEKNDVLFKFDDQILTNPAQLRTLVGTKKEGETVRLTYFRKGQEANLEIKIAMHEGGELDQLQLKLSGLMPGADRGIEWVKNLAAPLTLHSKAVIIDKHGNVLTENRAPDLDEAVSKLERTLKEAGVDQSAIEQARRALTESREAVQKAAGEVGEVREQLSREIKRAVEEAAAALKKTQSEELRERNEFKRGEIKRKKIERLEEAAPENPAK